MLWENSCPSQALPVMGTAKQVGTSIVQTLGGHHVPIMIHLGEYKHWLMIVSIDFSLKSLLILH